MFGIPVRDWLTYTNAAYLISLLLTFMLTVTLWRVSVAAQNESEAELASYKKDADVKIANANAAADQARREAADANLKTEQLRALYGGRRIIKSDQDAFSYAQTKYTTVTDGKRTEIAIHATSGDPESISYAVEIYFLLMKNGLPEAKVLPTVMDFSYGIKLSGPQTQEFEALKDGFTEAHIQFVVAYSPTILIEVGSKFPADFEVDLLPK